MKIHIYPKSLLAAVWLQDTPASRYIQDREISGCSVDGATLYFLRSYRYGRSGCGLGRTVISCSPASSGSSFAITTSRWSRVFFTS